MCTISSVQRGTLRLLAIGIVAILSCAQSHKAAAQPSVYPTGVTLYKPKLAYPCYVIFDAPDNETHMIDMNGRDVHTWPHAGFPSEMIAPGLMSGQRGDVFVQLTRLKALPGGLTRPEAVGYQNETIGIMNWRGRIVWRWGSSAPGGAAHQNHDIQRLAGGYTVMLSL